MLVLFRKQARSLDRNPIENIFNIVSPKLERDALHKQIIHETFTEYSRRVEKTLRNINPEIIDHTIGSMNKRIELFMKRKGHRLNY